jgi:hypothetical protein
MYRGYDLNIRVEVFSRIVSYMGTSPMQKIWSNFKIIIQSRSLLVYINTRLYPCFVHDDKTVEF